MSLSTILRLIKKAFSVVFISTCAVFLSCGIVDKINDYFTKKPEVDAIAEVLRISLPIGYAAQIAMAAVNGEVDNGVTVLSGIVADKGPALVTIPVTAQHPLPAGNQIGTIVVSGYWSSMDEAVMAMALLDLNIATATASFANIKAFPVLRDSTGVKALFVKQWVNLGQSNLDTGSVSDSEARDKQAWADSFPTIDSTMSVEQDVWMITVRDNGTPSDPSDDEYGLVGAGQYAGIDNSEAYLVQLIMLGASMKASCRSNPVVDDVFEGGALLNTYKVETGSDPSSFPKVGRALFIYHNSCDGKIDLKVATGCYIGRIGDSFALNLN